MSRKTVKIIGISSSVAFMLVSVALATQHGVGVLTFLIGAGLLYMTMKA